jgi:hypothetical protein
MPDAGNRGVGEGIKSTFDTAKAVLVPVELFEKGTEEAYLRFNGMAPTTGETAVASEPVEGLVAVMAIKKDLKQRGGGVTSPLLFVATRRGSRREVNIHLTDKNFYFAVRDKNLRRAEALPDNSVDSILYYLQMAGRRFRLRRFDINVSGQRAGLVADTLRRYYPHVRIV